MDNPRDHFIVCGLGSLGQQTIVNLKKFSQTDNDIEIAAIDLALPTYWEVEELPHLLTHPPIIGDCRRYDLLKRAGIERCRSILITTSDESVNVETALAARRMNRFVHIVLRSSRVNLNQLLRRQLGHFVALDAMALPANTFALASMGSNTISVFKVNDYRFRVVQRPVVAGELPYDGAPLQKLHRRDTRCLDLGPHQPSAKDYIQAASHLFHRWRPDMKARAGDQITYIEVDYTSHQQTHPRPKSLWGKIHHRFKAVAYRDLQQHFFSFWQQGEQQWLRQVSAIAFSTVLISWPIGTVLIKQALPQLSWSKAISLGVILLLGGYGDVFGGLEEQSVPAWLPFVCLLIALASLFLVLSVFSVLADRLLSSRFEFLRQRPRLPSADHVIVVGIGRLGYRALNILQEFNQPVIGITEKLNYLDLADRVPLLTGNVLQQLQTANLSTAKSVVAVTDDPMLNLEIALIVSEAVATSRNAASFTPIVRTINQALSENLAVLLPQAKAFSVYALSAEAFAGAAFGENILSLFRLQKQTVLVTEYFIESGDHLSGKLLAEVAYGYGVVPILLKTRSSQGEVQSIPLPSDEQRLKEGDQLHVLSSINGLKRIERGEIVAPRHWRMQLGKPLNQQVLLSAGNVLVQLSGLDLSWCRRLMNNLPTTVELSLYDYQAHRLQAELQRYIPAQLTAL
ncbi:MAG: NAD-binding protein [Cyanobacteria bacterium J06621_3]